MLDEKDALQVKIDRARLQLPEDARAAIDAVDWRGAIMQIRNNEGYDFIQLAELETETELLLCGLANPEDYPRQIEKGMGISREATQKLVEEMNEKVFKKIKEEMIKIAESKKLSAEKAAPHPVTVTDKPANEELARAGIQITGVSANGNGNPRALESREEILERIEKPALPPASFEPHPLLAEKLSKPMQIPSSKTVHSLDNLTKPAVPAPPKAAPTAPKKYEVDPYRETPQ